MYLYADARKLIAQGSRTVQHNHQRTALPGEPAAEIEELALLPVDLAAASKEKQPVLHAGICPAFGVPLG